MFCDYHDSIFGSFGAYAFHTEQLEKIIKECVAAYYAGETSLSVPCYDELSDSDVEYIQNEVRRRIGM